MPFRYYSICAILIVSAWLLLVPGQARAAANPIEIGTVRWNTDFDGALRKSSETGKPVLALFQEVPGCSGCKSFGQVVLSHPLIVEAIETEFVPVVIYNNRGGADREILERYNEPAWNYQVIRFLNSSGSDLIPRKDGVWTIPAVAARIEEARKAAGKTEPLEYLTGLTVDFDSPLVGQALFKQYCFWTGEAQLGAVAGVLKTEAGFYGGEVTRVWYDKRRLTFAALQKAAKELGVADESYCSKSDDTKLAETYEQFDPGRYRIAPASDQKKQIQGTQFETLDLNEYQATKVNAFARKDPRKASEYLSPRQALKLSR